jgi:uncharacterized protein YjdB
VQRHGSMMRRCASLISAGLVAIAACSKNTVGPAAGVDTVFVAPETATVSVGATLTLNAEVRDADGNLITSPHVSWASADASIAAVSPLGVVTGHKVGTVMIAASAQGKDAFASITVTNQSIDKILVTPANPRIREGRTVQLIATAYDATNHVIPSVTVTWSSSNTNRATVSSTGLVLGIQDGTLTITASARGKSGSTTVRVDN